jgi:glycosyltransferase involved in cell wall biosynthesis
MRVAFVTGPVAAGRCGVGDYTRLLAAAMERRGIQTAIIESPGPAAFRAFRLCEQARAFQPDVMHLQYPTAGFGKGLTAQFFSLVKRFVLTLHEVEGTHLLRRLSIYPLWGRALHVVFTCDSNRRYSLRWAPWLRGRSSVIPLSSNIPVRKTRRGEHTRAEVIYFGLVRPGKGIEDVLEFARLASAEQLPISVRIIGGSPSGLAWYLTKLQEASASLTIAWELNLSAEAVAERLASATMAYMPFPDGASERHASILAALTNGLPLVTTRGGFTPPGLEQATWFCATPAEAVAAAKDLLEKPSLVEALRKRALEYARRFSWESIAESHVQLYERIMAANLDRRQ